MNKTAKQLAQGTLILTIASLIVKILSAIYRVPFQNLVGDEGFYVYQQVYPIYGLALTLSLSGIPVYISKMIAESSSEEEKQQMAAQLLRSLSKVSFLAFLAIEVTAPWLAGLMGDSQLVAVVRVAGSAFLLAPLLASYRGYYQGHLWMEPTAVSQVCEQFTRVFVILVAAGIFALGGRHSIYWTGTWAMSGSVFGALVALVVLVAYRRRKVVVPPAFLQKKTGEVAIQKKRLWARQVWVQGGLLSLYSAYLVCFQLLDSFSVKTALGEYGLADHLAKMTKGVFDRGQPLVQVGLVIALAVTTTHIPVLAQKFHQGNQKDYRQAAREFTRVSWVIAWVTTIGLVCILPFLNRGLFENQAGTTTLSVFALATAGMTLIQTYQALLQSQDRQRETIGPAFAGLFVKAVTVFPFTKQWGTVGASWSTVLGLAVCAVLLAYRWRKLTQITSLTGRFMRNLVSSLLGMALPLLVFREVAMLLWGKPGRLVALGLVCLGALLGVMLFFFFVKKVGLFTETEWRYLPAGEYLEKIGRRGKKDEN